MRNNQNNKPKQKGMKMSYLQRSCGPTLDNYITNEAIKERMGIGKLIINIKEAKPLNMTLPQII